MSIVFALMIIVAGMAVSLAIYFLVSALFSYEPQMKSETVNDLGVILSTVVFALCGPVLVLKLFFSDKPATKQQSGLGGFLVTSSIAIFWSATIGLVTTQSFLVAIAPVSSQL